MPLHTSRGVKLQSIPVGNAINHNEQMITNISDDNQQVTMLNIPWVNISHNHCIQQSEHETLSVCLSNNKKGNKRKGS